ncbi:MAG: type II secretion system protein [Verrucomicrobiales bacterium]|nr:type II secretion system protein [Verrucomicrobiales bacterium]
MINTKNFKRSRLSQGFTMVEMLIVIAVIGVMSALVISAFTGAAQDTRKVIARQQQAAVQNAVNAWVNSKSAAFEANDDGVMLNVGLSGAMAAYNGAETAKAKLNLVGAYLDESTLAHLIKNTSDDGKIQSQALKKTDQYLALEDWAASSYPKVELK